MKLSSLLLGVLLALFAGAAAAGDQPAEKRVVAVIGADGVQRVEVAGGQYYFEPNVVVVKVNVPVELKVRKAGGMAPHDITIKAPEAGIEFSESLGSEPKTIAFTPKKTGVYPFECTKQLLWFKSHKDRGMHGVLEVVE